MMVQVIYYIWGKHMRGYDQQVGAMFSYVSLEARVHQEHPLRVIGTVVNEAFGELSGPIDRLYARIGRPSIAPDRRATESSAQGPGKSA